MKALREFMPGCEEANLRNFGMTIGIRDTRKIEARYDLAGDDVREQARFEDSIAIFPAFILGSDRSPVRATRRREGPGRAPASASPAGLIRPPR